MAKVKTNFASLTDAQSAAPSATGSANTKSTGFNFSSLADSDVATPEAQPSKKKVDTGLSGETSSTVGVYKPINIAVPKATEDDDSIFDSLIGFASTVKNSLSPAMRTLPVNLISGGVAFATNLVTGVIKGSISEEDFKKDPYLRDIVDTIEKPSKDLLEAAASVNRAVEPQIELAKRQAGIKEEYLNKPISDTMNEDFGQGIKKLGVAAVSQIPQLVGLAMTGGGNKARTFVSGATLGTTQAIQQEYEQDKDVSGVDVAQSVMKGVIEGLTEMIFDTDLKAAQNIGKSIIDVTMDGGKKAIKDMIESVGVKETRDVIVRNYKDVVKNGLKGMKEESLEEIIATGASFMVDAIDSGKLNVKDYKKLIYDLLDSGMIGAAIGGPISAVSAVKSKKTLTEEQKASVNRFQEVANNKELSPEIRNIAKNKIKEVVDYDSDLVDEQYNKLSALPLDERIKAFGLLSKIDSANEDGLKIKDIDLLAENRDIKEGYKNELESIFAANKPSAEEVPAEATKQATPEEIQTEQEAYQEELAKADASFKVTMGIPTEPMKVSPDFSLRVKPDEIGINNAYEPSPNMPLEIVPSQGKRIQFSTKKNPDALLEGDVYTVNQGNKKFATILSTQRNGVQEYYVPELDDAKGYANLDDAKFAVQEKLTGVRVDEITRSGINRLRADMLMPKADIPIVTDNGQEVLLDPVAKKSIGNAVKAFKTVSNAPVYLYKNTEDFKKGLAKELGDNEDAIDKAGAVGGGFFTNERGEDSIHINLANATETTVAHEIFHGTLVNVARQNPAAFAAMRDAVVKKLDDSDLLNVYDDKGKLIKLTSKEYLNRFSSQYSPSEQAEEFLSELTALLATDKAKLKDATIWESIKLAIRNLIKTAGINIPVFEDTADINDTVKFFNDLSKSLKTGQEIIPFKLKTKDEKQTVKQGAAVQATDGEGKIAEEDEGLRDSVSETVKQRRKGNELGKKKRKLSAVAAKAMAIEPTTPDDYALQYFINGGQVIRGSKDNTTEKDTVFSLFSKSRMGGAKESVSEMRARVRIMAGRDAGGLSISEIAEKIFAEYQQATKGDVGIDVNTQYDFMDFKNAVESAILGHKSDAAMANTLLESKNQSTEEGAAALTEEEELEALRIKAEAQSMGMTEEEFMAKLAELQDTPEMQAADEAYAQALDMINDEDFAKLYELNDEDIAKIDELMAGLESTEGTLDDKLAEQKKIVRGLESERKKVLAAIEKAGKETQLDITGKAPIQEQLFGADTKSLTDRLQSIDTQLAAAKADVAATQSAIDFQERGTVDMFEGKTEAAPKKSSAQPLSEKSTDLLKIRRFGGNEQLEAWTEELELLDEKINKLESAGKGRGIKSLDWIKEQAESYRGLIKRKKIELAEIEAELAAREKLEEAKPTEEVVPSDVLKDENGKPLVMYVGGENYVANGLKAIQLYTFKPSKQSDFSKEIGFDTATVSLANFKRLNYADIMFNIITDEKLNTLLKQAKNAGVDGVIAIDGTGNIKQAYVFDKANIKEAKIAEKPQAKSKPTEVSSESVLQLEKKLYDAKLKLSTETNEKAKSALDNNIRYLKKAIEDKKALSLIEIDGGKYNNTQIRLAERKDTTSELQYRLDKAKSEIGLIDTKIDEAQALLESFGKNDKPSAAKYAKDIDDLVTKRVELKIYEEDLTKAIQLREAREAKAPAKAAPAIETKAQSEMKFLQGEIGAYEREIENSLEEIENTKSNYREAVAEIKEKKAALAKEKLSRDERDERKDELDGELEDAADERDTYIEQYKDTIADAKSELKKLNKQLSKLQEQQNISKATAIIEESTAPRVQTKEEAIEKIEQERRAALKKAPLYPLNFNEPNYEKNKAKFESEKIKEINDSYDAKIATVNSFFARKGKFQKQGIKLAPKSVGEIYNKYPNVVLDIFISDSKKEISLDRIIVPKEDRNKGVGTDIVNDVVRYADANGYRINLTPSGDFGGSKDRLTKFYKGFGFVENKGKNKDFSTKELMYRLPLDNPATEEINAQFTATRDNTPIGFNYDTDLVARERFNIPTLKRIGEGSDRVVFDLGDGNVLKVAKTARGLAQNMYEGSYDLVEEGILPKVLETGLNYIVAEKVESAKGNKAVNELMRELKNFYQTDFNKRNPKLQDVLESNDLGYVMNYDILYGDFSSARNWGVKNGKPIHLDGGTFGGIQMLKQYSGVKNLDDNDFREVYYKSRQAKTEFGDKDKFTKFQKTGVSTGSLSQKQKDSVSESFDKTNEMLANKFDIPSIAGDSKTVVAKYQAIALRHGSPYNFDKFTLNKVGAGEGQQVYGHGLYFSEDPEIAKAYSRANQGNKLKNLGILDKVPEVKRNELYKMMQKSATTINDVRRWLDQNKGFFGLAIPANVRQQVEKAFGERALYTVTVESQDWRNFKWLDWGKKLTNADIYVLGSKAKTIVPEMNKALINLVNNQKGTNAAAVQKQYNEATSIINMAETIGDAARSGRFSNMTGQEFYQTIQKSLNSQKNTSELLYMFGYDGVRVPTYFMLSGGLDTGKSNYVVFNDRNIKITGKQVSKFQKTGVSTAPVYKYQMNEMFKDPERLITDIKSKYDLRTTLRERGKIEGSLVEVERKLADNMVIGALSRMAKPVFKGIGALENAPLYKSGKGEDVRTKDLLMQGPKFVGAKLRKATLEAIQGGNKYSAQAGRAASSLIGNLAKTEKLQEARKKKEGLVKDQNNEIAMLSKSLNGMIGFSQQSLMRVHSLLDPEAFLEEEGAAQSPKDLDLQELRLYNVLRDMNDFIHEWHFQNEFIDAPTYEKHKGKYFARMYEEIERKEFADLHDAIDKMPSGADFRMFKERKDFSEIELTLLNDPIYITSRRFATMIHNKAIIEFSDAIANDPAYKTYKKLDDIPEENRAGFKLLDSAGGGKRYGQLTNKYVPITLYEELRGTTFANKYISMAYDMFRGYDGTPVRQYLKKSLTVYQPATRLGNITSNFAFGWLAGVDPFTMIKNRTKAKDSLDNYDVWAKDLAAAGILGTDIISADLAQRKKDAEKGKANFIDRVFLDKYAKGEQALVDKLTKLGASKEKIEKAKQARDKVVAKAIEGDKYLVESYGRTDDISKIALYRSLVDDYGKSKDEAVKIVAESMQNYTTVGKAYQFFSKMPLLGNPFVKFSSDLARIISNGLVNRPLYTASFLGMLYGMHRILSALSGEPEEEREARVGRPFIPKIPLGFTDIPLVWKVGKIEINVAKFISPYYVYDAGYRSNTLAELSKFAPLQLSYEDKVGIISDYLPMFSDPTTAPLAQLMLDSDFKSMPIADTFDSIFTRQTVTEDEAAINRLNYFGKSYFSPIWGMTANLIAAAKGEPDMYGRRRDIGGSVLNNFIKVQEFESEDVQRVVINQIKYIDSEYKQIKTDITSRRNNDSDRALEIMQSDLSEERKREKISKIDEDYRVYVGEMVEKMQILTEKRADPWNKLYNMQHPKKND